MPDSVRMMDLAALTRSLDEWRHLDPANRALARRLAAQLVAERVEQVRQEVRENEQVAETRIRDRQEGGRQRRGQGGEPRAEEGAEDDPEALPEQDEGHLLDIRA